MDCSPGTIVWVRRRNGSWWPGKILGPEELSASHLMSPRSGTPVKLLGREDASVDWYNLEKSKRVKAFRCGEFDACIERAEASHGVPIKKREKYARREDAILHALELERHQTDMEDQKCGSSSIGMNSKTLGAHRRELNSFRSLDNYIKYDKPGLHRNSAHYKSEASSRKTASSHEEEDNLYVPSEAEVKQIGWTEQDPEAIPRIRGVLDFGLRTAPPKKIFSQSTWETSGKLVTQHVDPRLNAEHMLVESASYGGGNNSYMIMKKKRPQGVRSEDYLVKKRDRRRPLVQVLQSSSRLPTPHSLQSVYDTDISIQGERDQVGVICKAKRSRCVYLPADSSDSMEHGGYPGEQMAGTPTQSGNGNYLDDAGSLTAENTSSSTSTEETESDTSHGYFSEPDMDENVLTDATQILLPGSRNCEAPSVHITENYGDPSDDEKPHHAYTSVFPPQDQMDASANGVSKWNLKGKRNTRQLPKKQTGTVNGMITLNDPEKSNDHVKGRTGFVTIKMESQHHPYKFNNSENDSNLYQYWNEADDCHSPDYDDRISDETETMLIDVELKVQAASYQGEHVPLVSLMSRLNGKAIVGHPVQIEILEDGSKYEEYDLDSSAVWKTARRSLMQRVPRSSPLQPTEDDEDEDQFLDKPAKNNKKKGKSHKKVSKNVSSSSQKTRTLSSFARERSGLMKPVRQSDLLNGFIKTDVAAPLVTCVPAKVVFSRIMESIGRPSLSSDRRTRLATPAVV